MVVVVKWGGWLVKLGGGKVGGWLVKWGGGW